MRSPASWSVVAGLVVPVLLFAASGCARPDWIEQTLVTVDVTGVWRGTSGRGGSGYAGGNIELTLVQSGSKVTGQYKALIGGPVPIEGTINGDRLNLRTLQATAGSLHAELQVNGDEMIVRATVQGIMTWHLQRQP